jgi:BirA family biotin operon repressor/biotin-[acetyl-CoA-carboxylase] ligase
MPDAYLDADEIRVSTFIRHAEIHDTLGSTNDRAADLARDQQIELPALIAARHQTAGRGRGNNKWSSSEGALTVSVLLEPAKFGISTANWPQLSLATAVAVCDAISKELIPQSARLAIKWPNDVMLDDAKLCGILLESPGGPAPAKDRLIIGLGINVNNAARGLVQRTEKQPGATSLSDSTGRSHNVQQLLCELLRALKTRVTQLSMHDPKLPLAWQHLCWLSKRNVSAQVGKRVIDGICAGIADDGALLIQTASATSRIYAGSLRLNP